MHAPQNIGCCQSQSMQAIKNIACSKPAVGLVAITALAVAILGGLALAGMYYPTGPLGVLSGTFGHYGTFAMLAGGLTLLAATLIGKYAASRSQCCKPNDHHDQSGVYNGGPLFEERTGGTGAPSQNQVGTSVRGSSGHDNLSFEV